MGQWRPWILDICGARIRLASSRRELNLASQASFLAAVLDAPARARGTPYTTQCLEQRCGQKSEQLTNKRGKAATRCALTEWMLKIKS